MDTCTAGPHGSTDIDAHNMYKHFTLWLNSALMHGTFILLLWSPQPLRLPTQTEWAQAYQGITQELKQGISTLLGMAPAPSDVNSSAPTHAPNAVAELPQPLLTRAKPLTRLRDISCPPTARHTQLKGEVFIVADINAQGRITKTALIQPSPDENLNQIMVHNFSQLRFKPATNADKRPTNDQIHFNWPYDCSRHRQ